MVGAREKLNSAAVLGALIVASLVGGLTSSWLMFLLTGGVLLSLAFYGGDIRLQPDYR